MVHVYPHGAIIVKEDSFGKEFTVNEKMVKHYWGGEVVRKMDSHQLHLN